MHSGSWFQRAKVLVLVLGLGGAAAQLAHADPFTYFNDFNKYGVQNNFACGDKGACGAVSTVNSFIFLENQYRNIYDNKLTPNYAADTNTDMKDAKAFGFDGWKVDDNPQRQGNYNRPGDVREQVYLDTKMDWINDYAPGTTKFNSWFSGSKNNDRKPTIADLATEIKDHEDVEFWVKGPATVDFPKGIFHVLTLTQVSCDKDNNCSIRYQDPNDPMTNQPSTAVTVNGGMLQFDDVPGTGYKGTVTITAAFSESPVPEPSTYLLFGSGFLILLYLDRRRRKRVA